MITNQAAWTLYERYLEGWKSVSDEERQKITAEVLSQDAQYFTRNHEAGGYTEIVGDMARFQNQFPGGHFEIGDVSTHHDFALLTWVLVKADGEVVAKGHDQLRATPDGKIASLVTFPPSVSKP